MDLTRDDTAVVVGVGNVALDVARILLAPVDSIRVSKLKILFISIKTS